MANSHCVCIEKKIPTAKINFWEKNWERAMLIIWKNARKGETYIKVLQKRILHDLDIL